MFFSLLILSACFLKQRRPCCNKLLPGWEPFQEERERERERSYFSLLWLFLLRVIYVSVLSPACSKPVQVYRIDAVNVIINIFMEKGRECTQKWSTKLKQWNKTWKTLEISFLSCLLRSTQFDGIYFRALRVGACMRVCFFYFRLLLFFFLFLMSLVLCLVIFAKSLCCRNQCHLVLFSSAKLNLYCIHGTGHWGFGL